MFDATELKTFCSTIKNYQKFSTKSLSIPIPLAATYLYESGFVSLLYLKNKCRNSLKHPNDLPVALSNCVPRYERRPVARFQDLVGHYKFLERQDPCFHCTICLYQIFLGATKFEWAQIIFGGALTPYAPPWLRACMSG